MAAAEIAAIAAVLLLSTMTPVTGAAAALPLGGASVAALALAWTLPAPLVHRLQLAAERVRASAATAETGRPPESGDDELATIARGVDSLAQVTARLTNLEADRARLAAILGGM